MGGGRPIKVGAWGRMLCTLLSRAGSASGGFGEAESAVFVSAASSAVGATDAVGDVGRSESATGAVNWTRSGCCITRVTSLESSPQSVSISSVTGGVDGNTAGASLVRRGGTEDDNP